MMFAARGRLLSSPWTNRILPEFEGGGGGEGRNAKVNEFVFRKNRHEKGRKESGNSRRNIGMEREKSARRLRRESR